jgi:lipopolysaccharide transport system permease protein
MSENTTLLPEVVYEAGEARRPALVIWREIIRETWQARELTWRLFVRDLSARYRQSVLGYVWAVAPAIATTVLFVYLKSESFLLIRDPEGMPYPLYVLFGMTIWQLFTGGLMATTQSLANAGSLIGKINFPREALIFSAIGGVLFEFLLRAVLVAAVFVWYAATSPSNVHLAWTVVFLPLLFLPLLLLTVGLGFVFSLLHAMVRDTATALTMALSLAFFLVPVIYPPPRFWPKVLVNDLNPVSALLTGCYDLTVQGGLDRPLSVVVASIFSMLVFFVGWRIFRIAQPMIAERV